VHGLRYPRVLIRSSFNSDEGVLFSPQPRAAVESDATACSTPLSRAIGASGAGDGQGKSSLALKDHRGMHVTARTARCLLHHIPEATRREHVQDLRRINDVQGNQSAVIACR
jgi:hypothetical protein